jgi:hypothetical protein
MSRWAAGRPKTLVSGVCYAGSEHAGELRKREMTKSDYDLRYPMSNSCDERETKKTKTNENAHVYDANHEILSLTTSTILDEPF